MHSRCRESARQENLTDSAALWDAPVAVTHRDHDPVGADHCVAFTKPLGVSRDPGLGEPGTSPLVEEHQVAAASDVNFAAVVKQRIQHLRPDATLLHARTGVGSEEVHGPVHGPRLRGDDGGTSGDGGGTSGDGGGVGGDVGFGRGWQRGDDLELG